MHDITLTYFDIDGSRGEECRLALHLAGLPFHDERIDHARWAELKPRTPFGSVPVLTVAGRGELAQTNAILTFIGRAHGLLPSDPWECARHEAILAVCEDLRGTLTPALFERDPELRAAMRTRFAETTLPAWAGHVEAQLGEGPFLAGDAIGVADLKLYIVVRWFLSGTLDHVPASALDPFPRLRAHHDAVAAHPSVVAWQNRAR